MPPQQLDQDIVNLARATRKIESGDNPNARGGSGEFGAYQYTAPTWEAQSRKYGSRALPLEQTTMRDQNEVFYKWAKEKKDAGYNIGQIASMHNAGEGRPNAYLEGLKGVNKYGVAYDTGSYAEKIARAYQEIKEMGGSYQPPVANAAPSVQQALPQIPQKPKGDFLDQASGFMNSIFPAENIGEAIGTQIAKWTAPEEHRQYIEPSSATAGGIAGDIAQNALYFTPVGRIAGAAKTGLQGLGLGTRAAGAVANVGTGAATGYGFDVASGFSDGEENPFTPGMGTAFGAAAPIVGGALSKLVTRQGAKTGAGAVDQMLTRNAAGQVDDRAAANLSNVANQQRSVAGDILQGTTDDAALGARVLPNVDRTGVKTYGDLSKKLQREVDDRISIVDSEFAADTTARKLKDLAQKSEVGVEGGKKIATKVNYVEDALKQLKELYMKTRDIKESARISSLMSKARSTGLTPAEINDLAKRYGKEFKAKGFSKVGQQLTSISDQAYENTRKGIKETARSFLKSDAAKVADKEASDIIKVKELVQKMEEKVNKLEQRVVKRNIVQKVSRALGTAFDVVTLGGPKAFITRALFPSGVGQKTLDSIGIEDELAKNLKLLDRLANAPDSEVVSFFKKQFSNAQGSVAPGDVLMDTIDKMRGAR